NEVAYTISYDATQYVRVSLHEVKRTLIECVVIVILVVFFFLQDWRAALIPTLAVPVSLVGCFFLMWTIGFTVNSLTLFGLILVIGIVVDDAIIVVENTQRLIDEEGLNAYDAARKAMTEVTGPILATSLVLMSIFIPTSMVPGITGEIYRQFALTIAGAVAISALCALTFAPALAAILLRKSKEERQKNFFFRGFNYCFNGYKSFYLRVLKGVIAARWLVLCLWFGILAAIYGAFTVLPTGFIPNEDQGVFYIEVKLPEGASAERTKAVSQQVQAMFDEDMTGIQNVMIVDGYSMLDGAATTNAAFGILTLLPWEERYPTKFEMLQLMLGLKPKEGRPQGGEMTLRPLLTKWTQRLSTIPEAVVMVYPPPPVAGLGSSGGIEYQLLDRGNNGIDELYKVTQELLQRARETGDFSSIQTTFSPYAPRYYLDIDRDKVQKMGVSLDEVFNALQGYYGSIYVNDFNAFNNVFSVFVQAHGEYRASPEDVLNMRFKNSEGKMVPIRSVAEIREVVGPQRIPRFQLYTTAYIQGQLTPGASTGQGMQMLEDLSKDFPQGFGFSWTGMSYQEAAVGSIIVIVFALCIAFAFLVLAAQYESWTSPLIILMAVPLAIGGALLFVALRGIDVNIYTQVGFILMVGLSAKNAILITEFATERRRHGMSPGDAAYEAGRLRLRPIMMTSFAFILGMIPLVTASGAGAVSRHAIGTPVFGGVLTETMIGVYTTPVLFVLLTVWSEAFGRAIRKRMGRDSEK
ncbi:MAG: efflux RND transporter permease subunit, partial [Planctomycetaceae bacterium]|nr:efflux RND transporter permease subunit [Planctomycetaceae bacterium]